MRKGVSKALPLVLWDLVHEKLQQQLAQVATQLAGVAGEEPLVVQEQGIWITLH